jgi:2-polyprenyl-3-methyl-5-hydroxy-6-metoxy-1,4-benzoquinol methylase
MSMPDFKYVGSELELFAAVHNWKSYWSGRVRPLIAGDTLEVGAGIGTNTPYLDSGGNRRWVCLEPDPLLTAQLTSNLSSTGKGRDYEVRCGTLQSMEASQFDTIVYIDVLEHIENDREELEAAAGRLRPGGRVIVLSPAHQRLFTPFDAAIGHFRRYNRAMIEAITPASLQLEQVSYLDSAGLLLSGANRFFLRQSMPTKAQLAFWDRCIVPVSRVLDRCFFNTVGKSIVATWRRESE